MWNSKNAYGLLDNIVIKPAECLQPVFTQCSCDQVTVEVLYAGVPYRLTLRPTNRTVVCTQISALGTNSSSRDKHAKLYDYDFGILSYVEVT